MMGADRGEKVITWCEQQSRLAQADTRGDLAAAKAVINCRREQQGCHPPLAVVMAGLQQDRAFASVHRRIIKIQLGHRLLGSTLQLWFQIAGVLACPYQAVWRADVGPQWPGIGKAF